MDRNSIIGLSLIGVIIVVYFKFFAPEPQVEPTEVGKKELITTKKEAIESKTSVSKFTDSSLANLPEKEVVFENKNIKVVISTLGARIKSVELKEHTDYKRNQLVLLDAKSYKSKFNINTDLGVVDIDQLNYSTTFGNTFVQNSDSVALLFESMVGGKKISKEYVLKKEGYLIGQKTNLSQLNLKNNVVNFDLVNHVKRTEYDPKVSKGETTINFYDNELHSINEKTLEKAEEEGDKIKWFTFKSKFFLAGIIPNQPIAKLKVTSIADETDTTAIKTLTATGDMAVSNGTLDLKYYFGPNHYGSCKNITEGFGDNVYLGWSIFNTINKHVTMPVFNFLEGIFSNYGVIIFILVLLVKIILFPLSYRSYLSMAKIKVLKPEMDEIKARVGDDMQAQQQEQMKLYQSVGVNPLAGCIPVLLQMPVLLAMFNFFPNAFELRHKSFLWADDLSTYDIFAKLPFEIPYYGTHISMFTILMTISTLVYTWYNSQMQTSMSGPMKYMQYVMPVIFLFVLNSMSAGLTYYYFISNLITIGQQFLIKSRVDETKIREKLDTFKKGVKDGTVKKSRWQQRLEDAMKAQEEAKKSKKR